MKLPKALTRNLGIKILALIMAIVVYYAIREAINTPGYGDPRYFIQPDTKESGNV